MNKRQVDALFWKDRRVFVTGHTGFKGSWLVMWLTSMGAQVWGYSLQPDTKPSLYDLCGVRHLLQGEWIEDIRELDKLRIAVQEARPEVIFHLAAQPLVRASYRNPVETYTTNVMGTVHLLEAARLSSSVKAIVNVTTDKCYDNQEWHWGYREYEPLGGYDPYSSSKACSELVTAAYRNSFFNRDHYAQHGVAIASARAGNVIGGGDWAADRLIPDCIRALSANEPILIRNPDSIRPWQHVLEPLSGYLILGEQLLSSEGDRFAEAWNFGPRDEDAKPVQWIVEQLCDLWGEGARYEIHKPADLFHEASYLKLDCSKARAQLHWEPKWSLSETLNKIVEWSRAVHLQSDEAAAITLMQIKEYHQLSPKS